MTLSDRNGTLKLSRRPSLSLEAANRLREAIMDGTLVQGQHLPEIGTAKEMGISRGPLREAFKTLATEGLLEIRQERGVFVASHEPAEIEQMVVARAVMEGMGARLFVLHATARDRDTIRELVGSMDEASARQNSRSWREIDWKFHEAMMKGSGNRFLLSSWKNLGTLFRLYMMRLNPLYDQERSRVLETHQRMAQVLLADDPDVAERLFRAVIVTSGFQVLGKRAPEGLTDTSILSTGQDDA